MCDTFVAGSSVTRDHHVILAKNSDREPNEAQAVQRISHARQRPTFVFRIVDDDDGTNPLIDHRLHATHRLRLGAEMEN